MRIGIGVSLMVILCSLSSCVVQKSITKKDVAISEAIIIKTLKPGKTYKFWHKKGKTYEKVKITSVDSTEIIGNIKYLGTVKPFRKTHKEIVSTTQKITYKKVDPVVTVVVLGLTTIVIIKIFEDAMSNMTTIQ